MEATKSFSKFFQIDWVDIGKSVRAGLLAGVGAFVAGITGALPTVDLTEAINNPRSAAAFLVLAGVTALFDLIRRALTDYSKL